MPEVFLDTDVAFDIISKRQPHFTASVKLLELAVLDKIRLMISESSLATLFYLAFDIYKIERASTKLSDFISACALVHAGKAIALKALASAMRDKEDALQYYTALQSEADYFITRNVKDFKSSDPSLPVLLPNDFYELIESLK